MVRLSGLSAAARAAQARFKQSQGVPTHVVATFLGLVEGEDGRARVSVDGGSEVEVSVGPGQFVVGSLVSVLVDSLGRPQRVLSAVADRAVGAEVGAPVETVTALPSLAPSAELSPEERARLEQVAADLEAAQTEFEAAQVELGSRLTAAEQAGVQAREDIQALDTRLETAKVDLSGIRAELADAVAVAEQAGARAAALEAEADRLASELGVTDAKAVAAREAADAAQAEADRLAQELAAAVSAAQAAQQTADQAVLDARDAHNLVVETQAEVDRLRAAGNDLLANWSFEQGEEGWQDHRNAVVDSEHVHSGLVALKMTGTSAVRSSSLVDVATGQVWEFSAWMYFQGGDDPGVGGLRMQTLATGSTSWASPSSPKADVDETVSGWQRVSFRYTVPAGVAQIRVRIAFSNMVAPVWVDDVALVDVTALQAAEQAAAKAQQDAQLALDAIATLEGGEFATEILESINGKNSITVSDQTPGSTLGVAVGDLWWQVADGFVVGQYTWTGSSWAASRIDNEMLAGLDVHKLQVTGDARIAEAVIEKLWVDGLLAKAITTSRLAVAPDNHYRDPSLLEKADWGARWEPTGGYRGGGSIVVESGSSQRGAYDMRTPRAPLTAQDRTRVQGGQTYRIGAWLYPSGDVTDSNCSIYVRYYDIDGNYLSLKSSWAGTALGDEWTYFENDLDVPAGASYIDVGCYCNPPFTGWARFSDITLRPKVGAVLIEDGAITAPKIAGEAVTADKLAANSVTARTLAVVPESGTGGLLLDARGLDIIPPDMKAGTAISMRVDTPAAISFAQAGATTFSVSPEGDLSATSVSANDSLEYRGIELQDILDQFPRGVMAQVKMQDTTVTTDTATARLMAVTFTPPTTPRMVRVSLDYNLSGTAGTTGFIDMKQAAGTAVTWRNSSIANAYLDAVVKNARDYSQSWIMPTTSDGWGWPTDGTDITVGAFIRALTSTGTITVNGSYGVRLTIEDIGPAVEVETVESYSPYESKGTDTGISKKEYTKVYTASSFRQFANGSYGISHTSGLPVQGRIAGYDWSTHLYFPYAQMQADLTGSTIEKVEVYVKNAHWGSASGGTVRIYTHNYGTAQTATGTMTFQAAKKMARGQGAWITLPNAVAGGFRSGTMKGLGLSAPGLTSLDYYGTFVWDGTARPKLRITYTK